MRKKEYKTYFLAGATSAIICTLVFDLIAVVSEVFFELPIRKPSFERVIWGGGDLVLYLIVGGFFAVILRVVYNNFLSQNYFKGWLSLSLIPWLIFVLFSLTNNMAIFIATCVFWLFYWLLWSMTTSYVVRYLQKGE